jgi:hypothetical protein
VIRLARTISLVAVVVTLATYSAPPAASASTAGVLCSLGGMVSTVIGKVCSVASHPGRIIGAGKKLLGGHLGGAIGALTGASTVVKGAAAAVGLAAIAAWVIAGARYALRETAHVIGETTRPNLQSTWFSASYWRMAAVSALLTLPFLFAAAIQALMRSDLAMLARAALGYLPLGVLAVSVAAPLTMLLLAASDELSTIVASASGNSGANFLVTAGSAAALSAVASPFIAFFAGLLIAAATFTLWIELLIREAAVYVIVLMLPLFFAALVWPARRIWAIRAVELLIALILSKFAIVAVLSLGGAALGHTLEPGLTTTLAGLTLVLLASFSPWALLRLLPLHELASGAASGLRVESHQLAFAGRRGDEATDRAEQRVAELPDRMLRAASEPDAAAGPYVEDGATNRQSTSGAADRAGPGSGAADGADRTETENAAVGGAEAGADAGSPTATAAPAVAGDASPAGDKRGPMPDFVQADDQTRTLNIEAEGRDAPGWLDTGSEPAGPDPAAPLLETGSEPRADEPGPSEDHDPRPPDQEPDEGLL